ncbi:hypothetical protein EDC29_10818 [Marichromatium gracile]|uniref:Uncharacterized protein n=1 Tax=Marichromatium gracile TaxID=1048 RepID=A0A4R4A7P0_MARGR|nr:hypothetical protein EDC29_10818 [Marichromatium gracile]
MAECDCIITQPAADARPCGQPPAVSYQPPAASRQPGGIEPRSREGREGKANSVQPPATSGRSSSRRRRRTPAAAAIMDVIPPPTGDWTRRGPQQWPAPSSQWTFFLPPSPLDINRAAIIDADPPHWWLSAGGWTLKEPQQWLVPSHQWAFFFPPSPQDTSRCRHHPRQPSPLSAVGCRLSAVGWWLVAGGWWLVAGSWKSHQLPVGALRHRATSNPFASFAPSRFNPPGSW